MTVGELKRELAKFSDKQEVQVCVFYVNKFAEIYDVNDISANGSTLQINVDELDEI